MLVWLLVSSVSCTEHIPVYCPIETAPRIIVSISAFLAIFDFSPALFFLGGKLCGWGSLEVQMVAAHPLSGQRVPEYIFLHVGGDPEQEERRGMGRRGMEGRPSSFRWDHAIVGGVDHPPDILLVSRLIGSPGFAHPSNFSRDTGQSRQTLRPQGHAHDDGMPMMYAWPMKNGMAGTFLLSATLFPEIVVFFHPNLGVQRPPVVPRVVPRVGPPRPRPVRRFGSVSMYCISHWPWTDF